MESSQYWPAGLLSQRIKRTQAVLETKEASHPLLPLLPTWQANQIKLYLKQTDHNN